MAEQFTLPGTEWTGLLTLPDAPRAPALVLFHEWWGLNAHIEDLSRRLAEAGFVVWAPDLYHGFTTKDATAAAEAMNRLSFAEAVGEVEAAVAWLRTNPRTTGRTGCLGFCMGGAFALYTAARVPELAAAAVFYGIPDPRKTDFRQIGCPVIAHFATRDGWASVVRAEGIRDAVLSAGGTFDLHVYDADHAFVNDTRPEVYAPEAASLAWARTVDFFHTHLG
jgi:carboxymethylenebutenolidase